MKQTLKKMMMGLAAVMMLAMMLTVNVFAAGGSSSASAKAITFGKSYRDRLLTYNDEHWYKFTLKESGYVQFAFSADKKTSSYDYWEITVFNARQEEVAYLEQAFNGGTVGTQKSTKVGLPAGTFFVRIDARSHRL